MKRPFRAITLVLILGATSSAAPLPSSIYWNVIDDPLLVTHSYPHGGSTPGFGHDGDPATYYDRHDITQVAQNLGGRYGDADLISQHNFVLPLWIERVYWKAHGQGSTGNRLGEPERCTIDLRLEHLTTHAPIWSLVPGASNPGIIDQHCRDGRAVTVEETASSLTLGNTTGVRVFIDTSAYATSPPDDAGTWLNSYIDEVAAFTPVIPGDTNFDGRVNLFDAFNVINHLGETAMPGALRAAGEAFPPDAIVNRFDLVLVLQNFGSMQMPPGSPIAVPEPNTALMVGNLVLGGSGLYGIRRWRRRRSPTK
jgi:hypothetical protein